MTIITDRQGEKGQKSCFRLLHTGAEPCFNYAVCNIYDNLNVCLSHDFIIWKKISYSKRNYKQKKSHWKKLLVTDRVGDSSFYNF